MRRVFLPIAIVALLVAPDVSAQATNTHDHDEAVRLFLEGKARRDENHCELAIAPLEASIAKEESIGAHYNLGVCYEKIDKRKSLDHYNAALKLAKDKKDDREREIRAQLSDFLDRTPHIRLGLPKPVPSGMKIRVEGEAIPEQELEPETIWFAAKDQPQYQVTVTAPGYEAKSMTVERGALATIVLTKVAPLKTDEGGFRWWHGAGIAAIVVGAIGVTYSLVNYITYDTKRRRYERDYKDLSGEAAQEAGTKLGIPAQDVEQKTMCTSNPPAASPKTCEQRATAFNAYNDNEQNGTDHLPLWLSAGIGGVLFIAAGTVFLVGGSSFFGRSAETKDAQAAKPTVRFVPTFGPYQHGAVLMGTF